MPRRVSFRLGYPVPDFASTGPSPGLLHLSIPGHSLYQQADQVVGLLLAWSRLTWISPRSDLP